jgi:dipeptidyl aminopeptidase/acylaminoacyl peptidase
VRSAGFAPDAKMDLTGQLSAARRAVRSDLGMGFGRALTVGLATALVALILADARLAGEPASRGEGRIAFTFGESGAEHPSQLAVMDADGKNRRALPFDDVHGGLSWSPDGRLIAFGLMRFSRSLEGRNGIYTIDVDRRKYRRVVRNGVLPDWSPNGRLIAFERGPDIWVFNLNDRRQRRIVRHGSSPSWSPDARKLAFVRGNDLWVLDVAAKKERRLVRNGGAAS